MDFINLSPCVNTRCKDLSHKWYGKCFCDWRSMKRNINHLWFIIIFLCPRRISKLPHTYMLPSGPSLIFPTESLLYEVNNPIEKNPIRAPTLPTPTHTLTPTQHPGADNQVTHCPYYHLLSPNRLVICPWELTFHHEGLLENYHLLVLQMFSDAAHALTHSLCSGPQHVYGVEPMHFSSEWHTGRGLSLWATHVWESKCIYVLYTCIINLICHIPRPTLIGTLPHWLHGFPVQYISHTLRDVMHRLGSGISILMNIS